MRLFVCATALSLLTLMSAATPVKKAPAKKSAPTKSTAKKSTSGKPVSAKTWRNRQLAPTASRYREIQEALAGKGFLQPGEVTGQWGPASVDALKRFQSAQNIESNGKINSLSLIALGLGPKRDNTAAAKPPAAQ